MKKKPARKQPKLQGRLTEADLAKVAGGGRALLPVSKRRRDPFPPLGLLSDRNAKKNFRPVDGEDVLAKVAGMPVTYWQYKWDADSSVPFIGPVAQDFIRAFYPGDDDTRISFQQADGVHFAAIKALERRTAGLRTENRQLAARNEELVSRLAQLEETVQELTAPSAGAARRYPRGIAQRVRFPGRRPAVQGVR